MMKKIGEKNRLISFFCGEKNLNKNKDFVKLYPLFFSPIYNIRGCFFSVSLRKYDFFL